MLAGLSTTQRLLHPGSEDSIKGCDGHSFFSAVVMLLPGLGGSRRGWAKSRSDAGWLHYPKKCEDNEDNEKDTNDFAALSMHESP
jgi:hypothetical protein